MQKLRLFILSIFAVFLSASLSFWLAFYIRGRRFALRDQLQKADAIVILAGTRGNIRFLNGKIATAVRLYQAGWAPYIIGSGKFSAKIDNQPQLIPLEELQHAVTQGRIQEKDLRDSQAKWDTNLGSTYIQAQAILGGVPSEYILLEDDSYHTRESGELVLEILQRYNMHRIILVTSPFHQLRTYLTFAKVFQPHGIEIINYYADTDDWNSATWFFSVERRKLVQSEQDRIKLYRKKGDLL